MTTALEEGFTKVTGSFRDTETKMYRVWGEIYRNKGLIKDKCHSLKRRK